MPNKDLRRFTDWCTKYGELVGLVLTHPAFGALRIVSTSKNRIALESVRSTTNSTTRAHGAFEWPISKLFDEEAWSWFSEADGNELYVAWRSSERGPATTVAERLRAKRLADVQAVLEQALADEFVGRVHVRCPIPADADYLIAEEWGGKLAYDATVARMLCARLAERAAATFYRDLGKTVIDVSITQLDRQSHHSDWRTHDLTVDGCPVDIKNARTSRDHPDRYVSHCVPAFKSSRAGADVRIAGVLSPWAPYELLTSGTTTVTILGETSQHDFSNLQIDANGTPVPFELQGSLRLAKFLPPWVFNYSNEYYRDRASAIDRLRRFTDGQWIAWANDEFNVRPALLLRGRTQLLGRLGLSATGVQLAAVLAELHETDRLNTSSIFVALLQHFITCLGNGTPFDAAECRSLLFWADHRDRPLFLLDPLKTISKLIGGLQTIASRGSDQVRGFTSFRLSALNFFQGRRTGENAWSTLIAYCGGSIDGHPCGKVPLVIGEHRLCSCRRLICPDCNYCSPNCPERRVRRPG